MFTRRYHGTNLANTWSRVCIASHASITLEISEPLFVQIPPNKSAATVEQSGIGAETIN